MEIKLSPDSLEREVRISLHFGDRNIISAGKNTRHSKWDLLSEPPLKPAFHWEIFYWN